MQILVYTSDFSVFINQLSNIMIQSNAKSLLDNTAMLYKQTSSRHDVCLDQRSFKCKIGENCSNILSIYGQNSKGEFHPIWNLHRVLPKHRIL